MMRIRTAVARSGVLIAGGAAVTFLSAGRADAAAFYLQEQSVKAIGRAFSGEVADRGPESLWWNPAAIGGMAHAQAYAGATGIFPRASARDTGTLVARPGVAALGVPASVTPAGGDPVQHDPIDNGVLPSGGFAMPLGEHVAIGVAASSPFSFTTNYGPDSWARYGADKTRLRTYDIQPVIAVALGRFSIGAGPNVEYVKATLSNKLPDPLSPLLPDGEQSLDGDGWDVGYSVGAQFHDDLLDIGASYKSGIRHTLKGSLIVSGLQTPVLAAALNRDDDAKARFKLPWQLNLGVRVHPTDWLALNGQVTRFGWNRFSSITVTDLTTGGGGALPENYANTWSYAVGFDYMVSPVLTMRGGVQRDLSPIHGGDRDARVPDGSRWDFGLGSSYALTAHVTIDAAASYIKIAGNPIGKPSAAYAGTPLQTVILTSGELDHARSLVLGLGGRFTF